MRIGTVLERLGLWLCFGLWLFLVSGWAAAGDIWVQDAASGFDQAYRLTDADLGGYQGVLLDPLSVWYAQRGESDVLQRNVTQLQKHFARVFYETLDSSGFLLVDEPGDGVLCLHVELVDMRVTGHTPEQVAWSDRFAFGVMPGHMTLVAEVRDTATGDVLLRIADQDDAGEAGDVWALVDEIFADWATSIAATLQAPAEPRLVARQ